jgi:hypothetical protein
MIYDLRITANPAEGARRVPQRGGPQAQRCPINPVPGRLHADLLFWAALRLRTAALRHFT